MILLMFKIIIVNLLMMNKSLFTKFRRLSHESLRELYDILDNPFASDSDKDLCNMLSQQINFVLALTDFDNVSS